MFRPGGASGFPPLRQSPTELLIGSKFNVQARPKVGWTQARPAQEHTNAWL